MADKAFLQVRYEDLLANPEQELRRICGFLSEEFSPVMLAYYREYKTVPCDQRNAANLRRPVMSENAGKWCAPMTPRRFAALLRNRQARRLALQRLRLHFSLLAEMADPFRPSVAPQRRRPVDRASARPANPHDLHRAVSGVTDFPAGHAQELPDPVSLGVVPHTLGLLPPYRPL